ncbi:unnamed protein product [Diatraea saccharalis]|uniref:Uncharacterized protein n=1 Tax=Diatraea saccharalis TaxID=40085 RepID=A0A9P0C3B4_9NEOP|nr:unnamed protein product [Diatraea saccharalis]
MSGNRRKLSFLGFSPQVNEDEVLLDEEMERVLWNEDHESPSQRFPCRGDVEPILDIAAPRTNGHQYSESTRSSIDRILISIIYLFLHKYGRYKMVQFIF